MFKVFDENNDKKISFEEIISVLKQEKIEFSEKMIKSVFALSDDNKDGKIERKEFTSVIKLFYAEQLEEVIFKIADKNGNGTVDSKELKKLCEKADWKIAAEKDMGHDEFVQFVRQNMQ